jgi:hypothetical protein
MTARLDALHGEKIAAGVSRCPSLIERTNLPAGQRASAVCQFDQRRVRVGPKEVNDRHAVRCRCYCLPVDIASQEVRREYTGRLRRHLGKKSVEFGGRQPLGSDGSDAAGVSYSDRKRRS